MMVLAPDPRRLVARAPGTLGPRGLRWRVGILVKLTAIYGLVAILLLYLLHQGAALVAAPADPLVACARPVLSVAVVLSSVASPGCRRSTRGSRPTALRSTTSGPWSSTARTWRAQSPRSASARRRQPAVAVAVQRCQINYLRVDVTGVGRRSICLHAQDRLPRRAEPAPRRRDLPRRAVHALVRLAAAETGSRSGRRLGRGELPAVRRARPLHAPDHVHLLLPAGCPGHRRGGRAAAGPERAAAVRPLGLPRRLPGRLRRYFPFRQIP